MIFDGCGENERYSQFECIDWLLSGGHLIGSHEHHTRCGRFQLIGLRTWKWNWSKLFLKSLYLEELITHALRCSPDV